MMDCWSRSPMHISPAIVTTRVSLAPAVPPRFFDMNSPAVPPCPALPTSSLSLMAPLVAFRCCLMYNNCSLMLRKINWWWWFFDRPLHSTQCWFIKKNILKMPKGHASNQRKVCQTVSIWTVNHNSVVTSVNLACTVTVQAKACTQPLS